MFSIICLPSTPTPWVVFTVEEIIFMHKLEITAMSLQAGLALEITQMWLMSDLKAAFQSGISRTLGGICNSHIRIVNLQP